MGAYAMLAIIATFPLVNDEYRSIYARLYARQIARRFSIHSDGSWTIRP